MSKVVYKKYSLNSSGGDYYEIFSGPGSGNPPNPKYAKYNTYAFDRDTGLFTMGSANDKTYGNNGYTQEFLQSESGGKFTDTIYVYRGPIEGEVTHTSTMYSLKGNNHTRGSYIGEVVAEDGYYPKNGMYNGRWYVWDRFSNRPPTITGSTVLIGTVKNDFDISYTVSDPDGDDVKVEIRIDNRVVQYPIWKPNNVRQTLRIKLDEYGLGEHTITVTATDTSNASVTRTYYFTKSNVAPTISGYDMNKGGVYKDFTIDYIIQDADGDDVKVSILSDGYTKQSPTYTSLGIRKYYTVRMKDYNLGQHTIEIVAEDSSGAKARRTITFEKVNSAPIISGRDESLGSKNTSFSYTYKISDNESDSVRVVE